LGIVELLSPRRRRAFFSLLAATLLLEAAAVAMHDTPASYKKHKTSEVRWRKTGCGVVVGEFYRRLTGTITKNNSYKDSPFYI
jgi:hypothetical protein